VRFSSAAHFTNNTQAGVSHPCFGLCGKNGGLDFCGHYNERQNPYSKIAKDTISDWRTRLAMEYALAHCSRLPAHSSPKDIP
jgi:hypothetical protein